MSEQSRFPIIIEKCPNCGSTERMVQLFYDEEVAKGKVKPARAADVGIIVTPLFQPTMAVLTVPTLLKRYDDCARCGARYCVEATIVQAPIQTQHRSGSVIRGAPGNDPRFG